MTPPVAASDREGARQAFRVLRAQATRYAIAGTVIAVVAVVLATLLVCLTVYDGITLDNIMRAHRENIAIWALDAMPFLFAWWGQYASLRLARAGGSLVERLAMAPAVASRVRLCEPSDPGKTSLWSSTMLPSRVTSPARTRPGGRCCWPDRARRGRWNRKPRYA